MFLSGKSTNPVLYDHAPLISSLIKADKIHGGRIGEINWNIEWSSLSEGQYSFQIDFYHIVVLLS